MRTRTSAALLLLGSFLLGGISGAIGYHLYRSRAAPEGMQRSMRPPMRRDVVEELAKGLNLDDAQKEKLRGIFAEAREKYQALERQLRPQYQAIHADTDEAVRSILTEEQRKRFDEIVRRDQGRRKPRPTGPPDIRPPGR